MVAVLSVDAVSLIKLVVVEAALVSKLDEDNALTASIELLLIDDGTPFFALSDSTTSYFFKVFFTMSKVTQGDSVEVSASSRW